VRRAVCAVLLVWATAIGWAAEERPPKDLTELSLEELMNLDALSVDVLGTHTHLGGEWMLGYEFKRVSMTGNLDGTTRLSNRDVLKRFDVSPTHMLMEMHMPMLMYAPSDDVTLTAMVPYLRNIMDHVTREGARFNEKSDGIGDLELDGLITVYRRARWAHRLIIDAGGSAPTGSIDAKQDNMRLEYPMQLGSGTFALRPGLTYLGQTEQWAWMAETVETIRVGKNGNGYRLGNQYRVDGRIARKLTNWLSVSTQAEGRLWENIHGADPELKISDEPTKDPNAQGGKRVDLSFGVNLYVPQGMLTGHPDYNNKGLRFAIQAGFPVYESLDGPQLGTDWFLSVGGSCTFTF